MPRPAPSLSVAARAAESGISGGSGGMIEPLASAIFGMFQKPTIPFSTQYRTRIVIRLQPKNSTPTIGIAFATSRAIADRVIAVRR